MNKYYINIILIILIGSSVQAQTFLNPDLEGQINRASLLPNHWQNVPATDTVCQANQLNHSDTPDLTDITSPDSLHGLSGNPYSGKTFVSGLHAIGGGYIFHEGIMQSVVGFLPGKTYVISFYQSVVKQKNCLDQSGSWAVYIDSILAGITVPTFSNAPFNSNTFTWENRTITFTATDTIHTLKFLPQDDDPNITTGSDIDGAIRMGIDNINLTKCDVNLDLGNDTTLCKGKTLLLNATNPNASYLWQDNSRGQTFRVTKQGTYWVKVTVNNCTKSDTIRIIEEDCEVILEIPNIFTPNHDGFNDLLVPIKSKGIISMNTNVYNRWGSKVFETNNLFIEWDGVGINDGTYYWVIYYTDKFGVSNRLKGYVTVLK